jgi:hypothetical protein
LKGGTAARSWFPLSYLIISREEVVFEGERCEDEFAWDRLVVCMTEELHRPLADHFLD